MTCRLHIVGAAGSGTSTLGKAVAEKLDIKYFDTDDFEWVPTNPPYRQSRPLDERRDMLIKAIGGLDGWVLSGSLIEWGESFIPLFDAVIFLYAPAEIRVARLLRRETETFGEAAVAPGGYRHEETRSFLDWAAAYDSGECEGRSLTKHTAWLATVPCPVLQFDATRPVGALLAEIISHVDVLCQERH